MTYSLIGSVELAPGDREVTVGSFSLEEGHDTAIVRVTQTTPVDECWSYSFALLTWQSSLGQELGTTKIYGSPVGETYRLGVGLPPLERAGSFIIRPRAYNRRWISIADPPKWGLTIEATSIKSTTSGSGDEDDFSSGVAGALADVATDVGLELIRVVFTSP